MKIPRRLPCLTGWAGRCGAAFIALAFCASVVAADPSKNVITATSKGTRQAVPLVKKQYYMMISGSAIPQPIDRIAGPIATTAIPMSVFGNHAGD
jgi:hypothetical protein